MEAKSNNEYRLMTIKFLIKRKQYNEAHDVIEQILSCEPQCNEALTMLSEIKTKLLDPSMSEVELDYDDGFFRIDTMAQCLLVAVVGIAALILGSYFGIDMVHTSVTGGNYGSVNLHSDYTTHPTSYPLHTLLVLPSILLGLGGWLITVAFRSWREMKG